MSPTTALASTQALSYRRQKFKAKRKIGVVIWSILFIYFSLVDSTVISEEATNAKQAIFNGRDILNKNDSDSAKLELSATELPIDYDLNPIFGDVDSNNTNCTPPAVNDFPRDLFTQAQRRQGFLAVHLLASAYLFYCFALICDEYFVPCIECICTELSLSNDVAGATFMAIATSSPELFTNVVGTFITKGDLGVGAIVGSAVFNILGVCACCGIAAKSALPLDWYPLTRDCLFYSMAVILLIIFLGKRHIFWYEALILVIFYAFYILVMYKNESLKRMTENLVDKVRQYFEDSGSEPADASSADEKTPLLGKKSVTFENGRSKDLNEDSCGSHKSQDQNKDDDEKWSLVRLPEEAGFLIVLQWLITWPARFAFTCTVPDCKKENLRKFYLITFLMCIAWIAVLSYFVSWLMTVIGHTLSIPDSVMGLTFIAGGASIPEVISCVIVARQGLGSMSISNSIGSNIFDVLVCLGLPWLIRGSMIWTEPINYIKINSGGLEYSVMTLLLSVALLYTVLACNRFYLDKKVGIISFILYLGFITFACLFEMNVFMQVNLPTCKTDY